MTYFISLENDNINLSFDLLQKGCGENANPLLVVIGLPKFNLLKIKTEIHFLTDFVIKYIKYIFH